MKNHTDGEVIFAKGAKDIFMHTARIVEFKHLGTDGVWKNVYRLNTSHGLLRTEFKDRRGAYDCAKILGFKRVYGLKGRFAA